MTSLADKFKEAAKTDPELAKFADALKEFCNPPKKAEPNQPNKSEDGK